MTVSIQTVVSVPKADITPDGKIAQIVFIEIYDVVMEDGHQRGKSHPHRAALTMTRDGSWVFNPHPLHPETNTPYVFTKAQEAAWNAVLDVYTLHHGIADHAFLKSVTLDEIVVTIVNYKKPPGSDTFHRVVSDVPVPTDDRSMEVLSDKLSASIRHGLCHMADAPLKQLRAKANLKHLPMGVF